MSFDPAFDRFRKRIFKDRASIDAAALLQHGAGSIARPCNWVLVTERPSCRDGTSDPGGRRPVIEADGAAARNDPGAVIRHSEIRPQADAPGVRGRRLRRPCFVGITTARGPVRFPFQLRSRSSKLRLRAMPQR